MNEEQADKLIEILAEIKYNLDIAIRKDPRMNEVNFEKLKRFKMYVTADGFYKSLSNEQKQYLKDLGNDNTPAPIKCTPVQYGYDDTKLVIELEQKTTLSQSQINEVLYVMKHIVRVV